LRDIVWLVFEAGWCEVMRSIVLFLRIYTIMGEELKKSALWMNRIITIPATAIMLTNLDF
jgi:hypothetical protein